jgi:parallel beta-helix repeat protein
MIVSLAVFCSVLIFGVVLVAPMLQNTVPILKRALVVPDDYPSISDAVGNATEGTTIYVKKGTYQILQNDALVINTTLSIIGDDAENTILSGPGFAYGGLKTKNEVNKVGYTLLDAEKSLINFIIPPKVAIWVYADNFKISNLTIDNCDIGIYVIGNGTEVSNTIMAGLSVSGSYSKIFDNNITDALAGSNSYLSTFTVSGSYHDISHNNIANIVGGECNGSFNNITENTIQGDIDLKGSSNVITGNSFRFLSLTSADSNIIKNNTFSNLCLYGSSNNTIFGNTARGPGHYGILMSSGSDNVFCGNYIGDYNATSKVSGRPYGYGVDVGSMAENNMFYHNNFMNNYMNLVYSWNAGMGNINFWDNGIEGNYWSDYSGVDANGDGIGDTSYLIYYRNVDRYPLMAPFDIES